MASIKFLALFLLILYAYSVPLGRFGLSDMEAGKLGEDDELLDVITYELTPEINNTVYYVEVGMDGRFVNITYVSAKETGGYEDAKSLLVYGGPGYAQVIVRLIPGESQAFNYTVDIYGVRLENPDDYPITYTQFEEIYYL